MPTIHAEPVTAFEEFVIARAMYARLPKVRGESLEDWQGRLEAAERRFYRAKAAFVADLSESGPLCDRGTVYHAGPAEGQMLIRRPVFGSPHHVD